MDFGQCEAAFYLGGVRYELSRLPESLAAMKQALQCYDLALAVRRKLLEESLAKAVTPEAKARETARHERAIARVQKRREEALAAIEKVTAGEKYKVQSKLASTQVLTRRPRCCSVSRSGTQWP
jgi:hypothetical protein